MKTGKTINQAFTTQSFFENKKRISNKPFNPFCVPKQCV